MAGEANHSNQLEQFMLLAKKAKGPALIALINQLLEAPGVYVFGEFLELPCIQELLKGPNEGYTQLLKMFAYVFKDTLPPLTETQKNKLRHLTIVNLAANMQVIPYAWLLRDLEVGSVRQLEDLVIEAVYANVIRCKLDQSQLQLEVDACLGRDVRSEGMGCIASVLAQWCRDCESVSASVEQEVGRVGQSRGSHLRALQQIEAEVANISRMISARDISERYQEMDPLGVGEQEGEGSVAGAESRQTPLKMVSELKTFTNQRH
ncbi:COP9 signalosome complex subunit 7b isoform X2 [Esox lucius]|uniref:COP9 signalosome complex subunit 7b isoform X2 n=1 Tax=Esox lucius TaxID=8010 RepID=UPI001476A446|nr:COP9 signalosome complex subunit 7b isoform X2 [Esox lucius]